MESVVIGQGGTSLPEGAFFGCTALESVSLPQGMTNIGVQAFYNCQNLAIVALPASVDTIGNGALGYGDSVDLGTAPVPGFTIIGTPSTAAEAYAAENGFAFVSTEDIVWGGVNNEEGVTASDALMVLQAATGKVELTGMQRIAADVNGDGEITASDALAVLQYATEKIASFPVQI